MRMKKKPSLKTIDKEKPMNMTMTSAIFTSKDQRDSKLPPLHAMRRTTSRLAPPGHNPKQRQQTETTGIESEMFKSYYQLESAWVKPTEFMRDIEQLKLGGGELNISEYQIRLNEKLEKNMARIESLRELMGKWSRTLAKALSYLGSKKSNSGQLIEEVSFWRLLSRKFDELQYQFKAQNTGQLLLMVKNSVKTNPQLCAEFEEFVRLRDEAVKMTPFLKKVHMGLEESVAGNIQRFTENSDIVSSIEYLKRILLGFKSTMENCEMLHPRLGIVFEKINHAMVQKLNAAPLYPRELANISALKEKYLVIDRALSFYSNLLGAMEEMEGVEMEMEGAEHTREVLVNLLQILGYFEWLYQKKEVSEFSKLFSCQIDYVIYEEDNREEWGDYMTKVEESMARKSYEP